MPIDVACPACQAKFTLKDEFAGRKVRCSSCQAVIELPEVESVTDFGNPGLDAAFQRDTFLLHQKHLSINTRYAVFDEQETEIMHVVRPSHIFRQLLTLGSVSFLVILLTTIVVVAALASQKFLGDAGAIIVAIVGIPIVGFTALIVGIWLAPKRHITFYRDDSGKERLLEILQDQKFALRMANYTVRDAEGAVLGRFRKDYLFNLIRKRWDGFDANGVHLCVAREDSVLLSLLRRVIGPFMGLLRTNFVIFRAAPDGRDGQLIGEFNRKFTLFDRYVLDLSADRARALDRRMGIALGVLLDTAEKR
jgi:predicted Zn finger-like uncharacterized protein